MAERQDTRDAARARKKEREKEGKRRDSVGTEQTPIAIGRSEAKKSEKMRAAATSSFSRFFVRLQTGGLTIPLFVESGSVDPESYSKELELEFL